MKSILPSLLVLCPIFLTVLDYGTGRLLVIKLFHQLVLHYAVHTTAFCLYWYGKGAAVGWYPPVPSEDIHESGLSSSWGPHDGYQVPASEFPRDSFELSFVTWDRTERISVKVPRHSQSRSLSSHSVQVSPFLYRLRFTLAKLSWTGRQLWDLFPSFQTSQSISTVSEVLVMSLNITRSSLYNSAKDSTKFRCWPKYFMDPEPALLQLHGYRTGIIIKTKMIKMSCWTAAMFICWWGWSLLTRLSDLIWSGWI